jgi:hypothetical protein
MLISFYFWGGVPIVEWFAVGSSMIFALLLAIETKWLTEQK